MTRLLELIPVYVQFAYKFTVFEIYVEIKFDSSLNL